MVSVKCDMCGKDITNDTERTTFRIPHEETISDYDVCGDCSNKIEEFIKTSYKHYCELINSEEQETIDKWKEGLTKTAMFNKHDPDSCDGKICYKDDKYGCMSCPDFLGSRLTTSKEYIIACTKKHITASIPLRDTADGINIYPDAFNKED